MDLRSVLPHPKNTFKVETEVEVEKNEGFSGRLKQKIPPYGRRDEFYPSKVEDFGDGGSFPEIHFAQYPLNMGRNGNKGLVITTRSESKSLLPKADSLFIGEEYAKPTEEEEDETMQETLKAMQGIVDDAVASRTGHGVALRKKDPQFVKFTPAQRSKNSENGARLVKVVEMQRDPLEPAGSKAQRVPRPPPSPPPAVLQSPPRKLTEEERKEWKIPPCVSNWKNPKGRIIPLEHRLSADGRRLQEVEISDKHAKLSEALLTTEKTMRETVDRASKVRLMMLEKEKEKKEKDLSNMAKRVLEEKTSNKYDDIDGYSEDGLRDRLERDIIRDDLRKQRVKDIRLGRRKGKGERDKGLERDISEQIALGQRVKHPKTIEAVFDTRLFNQESGIGKGFGEEDEYNLYDKPFHAKERSIYRPKKGDSEVYGRGAEGDDVPETSRFKPDKDFKGVDRDEKAVPHTKPIEFVEEEGDDFGIGEFLAEAKADSRKRSSHVDEKQPGSSDRKRSRVK